MMGAFGFHRGRCCRSRRLRKQSRGTFQTVPPGYGIRHADEAMETLRSSGWNTPASKAFFEKYNMDWKPQFEANLAYLSHLYDCLKLASEKYWAAYESKM